MLEFRKSFFFNLTPPQATHKISNLSAVFVLRSFLYCIINPPSNCYIRQSLWRKIIMSHFMLRLLLLLCCNIQIIMSHFMLLLLLLLCCHIQIIMSHFMLLLLLLCCHIQIIMSHFMLLLLLLCCHIQINV